MNQVSRTLTRREKDARRRAEFRAEKGHRKRKWRRSIINFAVLLGGAYFILRVLLGWAYVDFDSALWTTVLWFGVPALVGSYVYQVRFSPERHEQRSVLEITFLTLCFAVCWVMLGSAVLIHVNSWETTGSEWVSGVVVEKHVRRHGRGGNVFSREFTIRTNLSDSVDIKVPWREFRATNEGDSLTIRMHTGRFGWKYARYFDARGTGDMTQQEIIDMLQLDSGTK